MNRKNEVGARERGSGEAVERQWRGSGEAVCAKMGDGNMLMCRQWWRVCWVYGDQEKHYRALYGRKRTVKETQTAAVQTTAVLTMTTHQLYLARTE